MGSMSLVKKGAIYLYDDKNIVWVGKEYNGDFLDRHYSVPSYSEDDVKNHFKKEISLKEAISMNLIFHTRFSRMSADDKKEVVKTMLEVKGLLETLDFLSQTKLDLSKEFLESTLK